MDKQKIRMMFFFFLLLIKVEVSYGHTPSWTQTIYSKVNESIYTVFGISTEGGDSYALGSAVAISAHTLATNCHVATSGNFLTVRVNNEDKIASLIYHNNDDDFCMIEVDNATFIPAQIRASGDVHIGEDVIAIGNPKGYQKTLSSGIISNIFTKNNLPLELDSFYPPLKHICEYNNFPVLQTDASISHGSSGGGLFDQDGNLIGIITSIDPRGSNIAFAIPTELILKITDPKKISSDKPTTQKASASSIPRTEETNPSSTSNSPDTAKPTSNSNEATLINYYGKNRIGLFRFGDSCFISIAGNYDTNKLSSTALWFPNEPNNLYIFSRVITLEKATNFMAKKSDFHYSKSKSFILIEKQLHPLMIIAINDEKNPVYVFDSQNNLLEKLINADYFLGQFYHYNDQSGMTTIKFELDGFTEAYAGYEETCTRK